MSKKKLIRFSKNGKKPTRIVEWVAEIISTKVSTKSIRSFTQQPPVEDVVSGSREAGEPSGRIAAHDLFSMFTADIIKEKTTFTR